MKGYGPKNKGNDHHLEKALACGENSPCQLIRKCIENSMENMHTDVKVYRVNRASFINCR